VTTVADTIVAHLKAGGVRRVYGLPGDSLNGFTDALRRDGSIQWLHVRHEEAAAFAATAEATLTGELAVYAASCGPGNTLRRADDPLRPRRRASRPCPRQPSLGEGSRLAGQRSSGGVG
jgi:hypothetical protein